MKLESLEDLYVDELKDLYSAENQLLEGTTENGESCFRTETKQGV